MIIQPLCDLGRIAHESCENIEKFPKNVIPFCDIVSGLDFVPESAKIVNFLFQGCFRTFEIGKGLYILRHTGTTTNDHVIQKITLNLINFQRICLEFLRCIDHQQNSSLYYASVSCSMMDSAIRIYMNRKIISAFLTTFKASLPSIRASVSWARQNFNGITLRICNVICIIKPLLIGTLALGFISLNERKVDRLLFKQLLITAVAIFVEGRIILSYLNEFFMRTRIPSSFRRNVATFLIVGAAASTLGAATTVGFGLASSIEDVFRKTLPTILQASCYLTATSICVLAINKICHFLKINPGKGGVIALGSIYLSAFHFIAATANGSGLAASQRQVYEITAKALCFLSSIKLMNSSVLKMRFWSIHGPLTWQEIKDDLISLY